MMSSSQNDAVMPAPQRGLVGCWLVALGLAMRCKLGEADDDLVRRTGIIVDSTLPADDPLHVEIADLARQWPHLRRAHQRDALMQAGDRLMRAVERSSWPSPATRADLEG